MVKQERRELPNGHYEITLTRPDGSGEIIEYDADDRQIMRTYFEAPKKA